MTIVRPITVLDGSNKKVAERLQKVIDFIEETEVMNCISITFIKTRIVSNANASGPWYIEQSKCIFMASFAKA